MQQNQGELCVPQHTDTRISRRLLLTEVDVFMSDPNTQFSCHFINTQPVLLPPYILFPLCTFIPPTSVPGLHALLSYSLSFFSNCLSIPYLVFFEKCA